MVRLLVYKDGFYVRMARLGIRGRDMIFRTFTGKIFCGGIPNRASYDWYYVPYV